MWLASELMNAPEIGGPVWSWTSLDWCRTYGPASWLHGRREAVAGRRRRRAESRGVVGFEVIFGAYSALSMVSMVSSLHYR